MTATSENRGRDVWLAAVRRYFLVIGGGNLAWEIAHLPLYTLWSTGTLREKVVAVMHCTAGDVAIASVVLLLSLALVGAPGWPRERFVIVATTATLAGLGYTAYSEWVNTEVLKNWAYGDLMPRLPGTGIGLSPMLQWALLPPLALWSARMAVRSSSDKG